MQPVGTLMRRCREELAMLGIVHACANPAELKLPDAALHAQ